MVFVSATMVSKLSVPYKRNDLITWVELCLFLLNKYTAGFI